MPFSFIEIEEKKSRVICFLFVFLVVFYFLTAYLVLLVLENTVFSSLLSMEQRGFLWPPWEHAVIACVVAFGGGLIHWLISTNRLIEKISRLIDARQLDAKDIYHQYFKNIIDEVSVAIGGRKIEGRVIPSISMNAFALEGFDKRCVIGVTEGLLTRLNRSQIEAVVAHEAGHIANGDCLSTTVTCALGEVYEEALSKLSHGLKNTRGRGGAAILLLYIVIKIMHWLSSLVRYFISRQREYRADAVSVRLTRNPLGLAEALTLISKNWRGEGAVGDKIPSIFIVNPMLYRMDEKEGLVADAFSTHPPIRRRIAILANMAHLDEKTLVESLKNFQRASPVASAEFKAQDADISKQWFLFTDQKWAGPYGLADLAAMKTLRPDQWVKVEGQEGVKHVYEHPELFRLFQPDHDPKEKCACPHCHSPLEEVIYEGAPVYKCYYCQGVLVERQKIRRILIRKDMRFSEEISRLAKTLIEERKKGKSKEAFKKDKLANPLVLVCPYCGGRHKMRRQFFVYSYPVEIDRCINCGRIWFDKHELEFLQYLYEYRKSLFDQ